MLSYQLQEKKTPSFEVIMEMLSERYGWTPDQIRQISMEDIDSYVQIIAEKERLKNKK